MIVALIYFATRKDSKTMTLADLITINYSPTSPLRFDGQGRTNAGNPKNSCDCNTRTPIDIRHSVDNFYFSTALFGGERKKKKTMILDEFHARNGFLRVAFWIRLETMTSPSSPRLLARGHRPRTGFNEISKYLIIMYYYYCWVLTSSQ